MTVTLQNSDIFRAMEALAPKYLAFDWDNVGLQIGSFQKPVSKVMVTLDVLETTVDEAVKQDIDLIIAHHPLFFKPLKQVNTDTARGRVVQKLLQHNISVYAAHTNLDIAHGGINDMLCNQLDIKNRKPLDVNYTEKLVKLAVFVPETHASNVRDAMSEQGAGYTGAYSHCSFQSSGQGTFKPLAGTDPHIGSQNELTFADEIKVETILPESKLSTVLEAMTAAHPYEEAAYDIYPVENNGQVYGIGRIGEFTDKLTLEELCEKVKTAFDVPHLRVTGDMTKKIKKVAILGGSGEKYLHKARQMGADAFITGDMTFHPAQEAWEKGLSVIDPGHHVEKVMKRAVQSYLENYFAGNRIDVIVSYVSSEPFHFI